MGSFLSGVLPLMLLVVGVVYGLVPVITILAVSRIRLRAGNPHPCKREEAPRHLAHVLACAEAELKALGFQYLSTLWAPPLNADDPRARSFEDAYWHPETGSFALVREADPATGQVSNCVFLSFFAGEGGIVTMNRVVHNSLPLGPLWQVDDAWADNRVDQWTVHRERLAASRRLPAAPTLVVDRAEGLKRLLDWNGTVWCRHMAEIGWVVAESDHVYAITAKGALRMGWKMSHPPKEAKACRQRPFVHNPAPDLRAARLVEMDQAATILATEARPHTAWVKGGVFVLTLVLAGFAFGRNLGPTELLALMGVLLFHELGHLAAMALFGYRNLSIFFLPFIGAAASGHKPHATPLQEVIVLLAGPLPGLLLVPFLLWIPAESVPSWGLEFLRTWVFYAVLLNVFNLLPFAPLDGGRIFELGVLGRYPYARAGFAALGVLALMAFSISMGSWVMVGALVFVVLSLPLQFRAAGLVRQIRRAWQAEEDAQPGAPAGKHHRPSPRRTLRAIAGILADRAGAEVAEPPSRRPSNTGWKGWQARLQLIKLVYPRLQQGVPSPGLTVGLLVLLPVLWLSPVVAALGWVMQGGGQPPLMQATAQENAALTAEAEVRRQSDPQRRNAEAWVARFRADFNGEADPNKRLALLERISGDSEDDGEGWNGYSDLSSGDLQAFLEWVQSQRKLLLAGFPPSDLRRLRADFQDLVSVEDEESRLAAVTDLIARARGEGSGDTLDSLSEDRQDFLASLYQQLARQSTVSRYPLEDAISLWPLLDARPDKGEANSLAEDIAWVHWQRGDRQGARVWMERTLSVDRLDAEGHPGTSSPPRSGMRLREHIYVWFLLDIGEVAEAEARVAESLQPGVSRLPLPEKLLEPARELSWLEGQDRVMSLTAAGWIALQSHRDREALGWFDKALAVSGKADNRLFGALPWWSRLIGSTLGGLTRYARHGAAVRLPEAQLAPSLDRIIALDRVDPEAARGLRQTVRESLQARLHGEPGTALRRQAVTALLWELNLVPGRSGWGEVRKRAQRELLAEFLPPQDGVTP